jgi:hypothetical protein
MSNFLFDRLSRTSIAAITSLFLIANIPAIVVAKPIKIGPATTFDLKGCAKSSDGQDVFCVGYFRNRDADKDIRVFRNSGTLITDYSGKSYEPDELRVSAASCRRDCYELSVTLVEGVDYKVTFIFKDVSLPSLKIALLKINTYGIYGYTGDEIKIRNIPVISKNSSTGSNSGDSNRNVAPSLTDQEELRNAANEVEKQNRERIAAARAEQQKQEREALVRNAGESGSAPENTGSSWLQQQINQGVLDLFGKPR